MGMADVMILGIPAIFGVLTLVVLATAVVFATHGILMPLQRLSGSGDPSNGAVKRVRRYGAR